MKQNLISAYLFSFPGARYILVIASTNTLNIREHWNTNWTLFQERTFWRSGIRRGGLRWNRGFGDFRWAYAREHPTNAGYHARKATEVATLAGNEYWSEFETWTLAQSDWLEWILSMFLEAKKIIQAYGEFSKMRRVCKNAEGFQKWVIQSEYAINHLSCHVCINWNRDVRCTLCPCDCTTCK